MTDRMDHHVPLRLANFLMTVVLGLSAVAGGLKNTEPRDCQDGNEGVSINDFIVWDGDGMSDVPVFSQYPCSVARTIKYETFDITARAGLDYVAVSQGTFVFQAGTTSATLKIRILGEINSEPDETFGVRLVAGAVFADPEAVVTIKER